MASDDKELFIPATQLKGKPVAAKKSKVTPVNRDRVIHNFTYHAPQGTQVVRYGQLRDAGKALALLFLELAPESRERSLALTALEEAVMWANAAIARNEKP